MQNFAPFGPNRNETKEEATSNSRAGNQKKMPAFVPVVDMQFINKLYADKDLASKQSKDTKKVETTPITEPATLQFQKLRDEYDPARPNDYEAVLEERRRRQHEEELQRQKEIEMAEEEANYIPLGGNTLIFNIIYLR